MKVWCLVPARGGSKSIRLKNMVSLGGRPLLDYTIQAGLASSRINHVICSTDHEGIAEHALQLGATIDWRPEHLATDTAKVEDTAKDLIGRRSEELGGVPDILVLLQPTSPFVLPAQIDELVETMAKRPECRSGQTVAPIPHNMNAVNQRTLENGIAHLKFEEERRRAYNKQLKEKLFYFANVYALTGEAALAGEPFFTPPSAAVEVHRNFAYDLDTPEDIPIGEAMLSAGLVALPHLN